MLKLGGLISIVLSPLYINSPFLILDSFSDEQNVNSKPEKLALEDKEHRGTINEIDIEEPFEIRHALE